MTGAVAQLHMYDSCSLSLQRLPTINHCPAAVLQGMLGDIFSDSFLSSPAFQIGQGHKTYSLKHIGEYYSSPGPCMVLYDDTAYNKRYADEYGSSFQKVDPSKGVTYSDYSAGVQQVNNKCRCTGVSQSGVATSG